MAQKKPGKRSTTRGTTPELLSDVASGLHRLCTHEQQDSIAKELARE